MYKLNLDLFRKFWTILNIPFVLSLMMLALLLFTAGNYGIFGDELYLIDCGKHLDFGYVDHPPLIAMLIRLSMILFGNSILGLKILPALAGVATVLLTAGIARSLGGDKFAQGLAALLILVSSAFLTLFSLMTMNAFDILFCTLCAYLLIKILNDASTKTWLLFGLVAGIGVLNKYTILVFGFSMIIGLLLTRQKRSLKSPWLYTGGVIVVLIILPHIVWQVSNNWPSLEFIKNVQIHNVHKLSPLEIIYQLIIALNPVTFLVWIAGLFLLFSKSFQKYRLLGIIVVIYFIIYFTQLPRFYYFIPIIPLLMAAGAIFFERLINRIGWNWLKVVIVFNLVITGLMGAPLAIPILPIESFVSYSQTMGLMKNIKTLKGQRVDIPLHFAFCFGWEELVEEVAWIYNGLPEKERKKCTIFSRSYGEAGAINYFGPDHGLPGAISGSNSYWDWGPGDYTGDVVITLGWDKKYWEQLFDEVDLAAVFNHPYSMSYLFDRQIYICRKPKLPLIEMWPRLKYFY